MKAFLAFKLPEEKEDHKNALNGSKYKDQIDTLYDEVFRPILKYEKPIIGKKLSEDHEKVITAIWSLVYDHFYEEE